MKKFWKKNQETEGEEVVELTPEEKKEKVKETAIKILRTIGAMAAGAGLMVVAIIGIGAKTVNETEEVEGDSVNESCDSDASDENSEE